MSLAMIGHRATRNPQRFLAKPEVLHTNVHRGCPDADRRFASQNTRAWKNSCAFG
jgi:hypothetical protein